MGRCKLHTFEVTDLPYHPSSLSFGDHFDVTSKAARAAKTATAFLFERNNRPSTSFNNPFGQEVEGWNSNCPPFFPGGRSHTHGFCNKVNVKKEYFPPVNPEPRPGVPPALEQPHRPKPVGPVASERPAWELPAQSVRQEQKLLTKEPPVPFTTPAPSPQKTQETQAIVKLTRQQHKEMTHKEKVEPPFVGPEAGEDVSPPPFTPARVEVDQIEPRPPLIVAQKTSEPESTSRNIGIVEDDPSPEEEIFDADPEAQKLMSKLTKEAVEKEEQKAIEQFLPKTAPGTPVEQGPFWPPAGGTAAPLQPIPARPGEANYNYGWTPPERRTPYSPPWPGGAPVTAVDRVEAVAAEVGNEASTVAQVAEDTLLNTTM